MKSKLITLFGWYGAIALLSAYGMIVFGSITTNNIWYHILNLSGALGITVVSFHKRAYPPAVLNLVYTLVALVAILSFL
jgi:hypothetical protein